MRIRGTYFELAFYPKEWVTAKLRRFRKPVVEPYPRDFGMDAIKANLKAGIPWDEAVENAPWDGSGLRKWLKHETEGVTGPLEYISEE